MMKLTTSILQINTGNICPQPREYKKHTPDSVVGIISCEPRYTIGDMGSLFGRERPRRGSGYKTLWIRIMVILQTLNFMFSSKLI